MEERRLGLPVPLGSPASSRESIDGAFVLFWRGGLGAERPRRSAPRFPAKLRVVLSSRGAGRRDSLCFESVPRSRTRPLQFLSRWPPRAMGRIMGAAVPEAASRGV